MVRLKLSKNPDAVGVRIKKTGMKTLKFICILGILTLGRVHAQVPMVNTEWISYMKEHKSDTVYVINFWATWCKPCIEELPYFEQLTAKYSNKNLKVILVSCDFKKQLDSRLIPFIKEKNIQSQVVFMDESNANKWIDKVDPRFSGAIPATLIVHGSSGFRYFNEGEMTFEELEKNVKPLIH
jgi:thiol-disulfide isomerase/thioredoxin